MMKYVKILSNTSILLILFLLLLYKSAFVSLFENVSRIFIKNDDPHISEIKLLKEKISSIENEYKNITELKMYTEYDYYITRLSYHSPYEMHEIYITGGKDKNIKENYPLINKDGVVGIINKVEDKYSKATLLTGVDNLSVKINDAYGTLSGYHDGLFILEDVSNYDSVNLNDIVYTSTLGTIKEKLEVGRVYKIEKEDIEKKIYVKSNVNFNNINYLMVVGDL